MATQNSIHSEPAADKPNALRGGHVAPNEQIAASEEERIVIQAHRAEQPEPSKASGQKATSSESESSKLVNNTGDDISPTETDADAASG